MKKQTIYTYLFKNKDKGVTLRKDTSKDRAIQLMGEDYEYLGEIIPPIIENIDLKYVLLENDVIYSKGKTKLYRIVAVKNIGRRIKAGDLGGYIDDYNSLSQEGKCFIHDGAKAIKSRIMDNAEIYGNDSLIYYSAITGNSKISHCYIHHQVYISDNVNISDAEITKSIISDNVTIRGGRVIAKISNSIISQKVLYSYRDCIINGEKLTSRNIYDDDILIFSDIISEYLSHNELDKLLQDKEEQYHCKELAEFYEENRRLS
jgi:hypothetical protein